MISLDTVQSDLHSIQIKDAGGDALAISASGAALIEAVDLDIRDLAFATDKVDVSGSTVALDSGTLAALESITVQNGAGASAVNIQDGGNSITVDATDLDIRDLSHSQDSVKVGDGTDFLAINADGSINVHTVEAGYASWKVSKETVTTSAGQLVAAPLSGRLRVEIQNLGSHDIFVKQSNSAVVDGLKIPKGSSWEIALDAGASVYAITSSGSSDVRVAEYAA